MRRGIFEPLERKIVLAAYLHVNDQDTLAVVNASTGDVQIIGELDESLTDIAFDKDGDLYGITLDGSLYEINPQTAETDFVKRLDNSITDAKGLAFTDESPKLLVIGTKAGQPFPTRYAFQGRQSDWVPAGTAMINPDLHPGGLYGYADLARMEGSRDSVFLASDEGYLVTLTRGWQGWDGAQVSSRNIPELEDVSALAADDEKTNYAIVGQSIYTIPEDEAAEGPVQADSNELRDILGATYYGGDTLPAGSVSGTVKNDVDQSPLAGWEIYIDSNEDGDRDPQEPRSVSDESGKFYFFGLQADIDFTIRQTFNEQEWEQAFPGGDADPPYAHVVRLEEGGVIEDLEFRNRRVAELEVRLRDSNGPLLETGEPVDFGVHWPGDARPRQDFWISNQGQSPLEYTLDAAADLTIAGDQNGTLQVGQSEVFSVEVLHRAIGPFEGSITISTNDNLDDFQIRARAYTLGEGSSTPGNKPLIVDGNKIVILGELKKQITARNHEVTSPFLSITDVAQHPHDYSKLFGIDETLLYEIDLCTFELKSGVLHGVPDASALVFSSSGDLFAAGTDVYRLTLPPGNNPDQVAQGSGWQAGDLAFVDDDLLMMSTTNDGLYRVDIEGQRADPVSVDRDLRGLRGLANVGTSREDEVLYGFDGSSMYVVDPSTGITYHASDLSNVLSNETSITGATTWPRFAEFDAWHNDVLPEDVNGQDGVIPLDALLISNAINFPEFFEQPFRCASGGMIVRPPGPSDPFYPDVNGDLFVSPIDFLEVVNKLNDVSNEPNGGVGIAKLAAAKLSHQLTDRKLPWNAGSANGGDPDGKREGVAERARTVDLLMQCDWTEYWGELALARIDDCANVVEPDSPTEGKSSDGLVLDSALASACQARETRVPAA
jgi:hypothetical protein